MLLVLSTKLQCAILYHVTTFFSIISELLAKAQRAIIFLEITLFQ